MAAEALRYRNNREIAGLVKSLLRYMPPARSRAQISRDASAYALAQSKPLMDSLIGDANRRIASGNEAIGSLTNELTSRLGPLADRQGAAYDTAKADSARQNAALAEFLHAHGAAQAAQLSGRATAAGLAPEPLQAIAQGGGDSAGGAAASRGTIGYDRLNADAASHMALARELPALAALAGVHAGRQLAAQTNFQESQAADKVRAGIPNLIQGYTTEAERENQQRGQAAISLSQGLMGQEIQKGIAAQSLGLDLTKLAHQDARTAATIAGSDRRNKRSTSTTLHGQALSHADRVAALKERASKTANKNNQKAIATARKDSANFAIKLRSGTLGGSSGSGSLYGGGPSGQGAVTDRHVAFQRVAVFLGNALGRKLETRLGQPWMQQAVDSILLAAGYPAPSRGPRGPQPGTGPR